MKAVHDIESPELVKALAHPARVQILGLLEHRTLTPKQMAREIGMPLPNISYHVRKLHRLGFIDLVDTKTVRGTVAHHYALVAPPRITAKAWEQLPDIVKEAMTGANLARISEIVNRAASENGFSRPDSQLQRMPYALDEQAFAEASSILSDALERIEQLEGEARERIGSGKGTPLPSVAVVMLFEAPDGETRSAQRGVRKVPRRRVLVDDGANVG